LHFMGILRGLLPRFLRARCVMSRAKYSLYVLGQTEALILCAGWSLVHFM